MTIWELTRGRKDLDWTSSKQWWVMVWYTNGDQQQSAGPYRVYNFDGMDKVVIGLPCECITPLFKGTDETPMEIGCFEIKPEHIWARMPAVEGPAPPNVQMEYNEAPWTEAA